MNDEQLRKKIQYSLQEGYSEDEIRQVLRSRGVRHSRINQALKQAKGPTEKQKGNQQRRQQNNQRQGSRPQTTQNRVQQRGQQGQNRGQQALGQSQASTQQSGRQQSQQSFQQGNENDTSSGGGSDSAFKDGSDGQQDFSGSSQSSGGAVPGLDLTGNHYRIKQQLFLTRYSVFNQNDEKVLKAKSKVLSIKTNIPFMRPDDEEPIFRVLSARFPNISNNYKVKSEGSGDVLAVLDRKRTLLNQVWRIRDPQDNSIVATIQNESTMLQFLRTYGGMIPAIPNIFALAPHTYNVTDVNDNQIGELEGELSIRDEYDLNLQDSGELDRESMIASIIAIDALEGN